MGCSASSSMLPITLPCSTRRLLSNGDIAFGSNSFRAEKYEKSLREAVEQWEEKRREVNRGFVCFGISRAVDTLLRLRRTT